MGEHQGNTSGLQERTYDTEGNAPDCNSGYTVRIRLRLLSPTGDDVVAE